MSVNELDTKKGGIDLNMEYLFRQVSGVPNPGETHVHRQDPVYSTIAKVKIMAKQVEPRRVKPEEPLEATTSLIR